METNHASHFKQAENSRNYDTALNKTTNNDDKHNFIFKVDFIIHIFY